MVSTVVSQKLVATGNTVYGQLVTVHENEYDRDLPGVGKSSFSVSVTGTRDYAAHSAGFSSLRDVKTYLHSAADETFTVYDVNGQEQKETRRGLGIPKGMVSEFGDGETVNLDTPDTSNNFALDSDVGDRQTTTSNADNAPSTNNKDSKSKASSPASANKNG